MESLEQRSLLDANGFVKGLYQELLHRSPEPGEVEGWVGALNAGASREQVAQGFTSSREYHAHEIENGYHDLLKRAPEPGAVEGWLARMQAGMTPEQFAATVLKSDEYFEKHGGNSRDWLEGVYHDVLNRTSDDAGKQGWLQELEHGTSREQVAASFLQSSEAHKGEVRDAYKSLLGREPDEAGEKEWVNALDHGMSHDDLLERMVSTKEYDDDHPGTNDPSGDHSPDQGQGDHTPQHVSSDSNSP